MCSGSVRLRVRVSGTGIGDVFFGDLTNGVEGVEFHCHTTCFAFVEKDCSKQYAKIVLRMFDREKDEHVANVVESFFEFCGKSRYFEVNGFLSIS